MSQQNGADILCESLLTNDIDVCFANPGTSEMHFVAALDRNPRMRCVLGLAEGVVTGVADGYARMADKPAATLLHLGPGLANGLANLHNARRARTPMVNIVGDHATYHLIHDAPLASDIGSLARPMSDWVGKVRNVATLSADTAEAIRHAISPPGISTLILPADCAWSPAPPQTVKRVETIAPQRVADEVIAEAARVLRSGARVGLLLGGRALRQNSLAVAGTIAAVADVGLLTETSNARIERGAGRVAVDRIPYPIDHSIEMLKEYDALILVGAKDPVGFFAYPGKPGRLAREDCRIVTLATPEQDLPDALSRLADAVGANATQRAGISAPHRDEGTIPDGTLSSEVIAVLVSQMMPEGCIICDEALTSARSFFALSQHSAPHDYLAITGGSIGIGIPLATGAAVGAPGRKVIGLQADGSGMYTVQALWTQAREKLDVVTIVFANQAYRILEGELRNVGVEQAGPNARRMLELKDPAIDWVSLAKGLGVEAVRVDSISAFRNAFDASLRRPGPFLIETIV